MKRRLEQLGVVLAQLNRQVDAARAGLASHERALLAARTQLRDLEGYAQQYSDPGAPGALRANLMGVCSPSHYMWVRSC